MKTPEEIATDIITRLDLGAGTEGQPKEPGDLTDAYRSGWLDGDSIPDLIAEAVRADRAQHVGVYVPATVHPIDVLFFREVWINGEGDDGTKLEMTRTVGGGGMVLEIDKPDGSRIVESINASEFTQAWAKAAMARS